MRTLSNSEITLVGGGDAESMCGELGIDVGDRCLVLGGTDWFVGQEIFLTGYWANGDSFGMNLKIDGENAKLTVTMTENGADISVTRGDAVIGGTCMPNYNYVYK